VAVNVVANDDGDIFIALDNTPVLQFVVVQHEYLVPPHTPRLHRYVSVGHVDKEEHE